MNTSLEIKEDGTIWLWPDRPVEPNITDYGDDEYLYPIAHYTYDMEDYEKALASAPRYLVSNQEVARELLFLKHCIFPKEIALKEVSGFYPIPGLRFEVKEDCNDFGCGTADRSQCAGCKKLAVIYLPEPDKEQRKNLLIEMMQEDEKNGMYEKSDNELIDDFYAEQGGKRALKTDLSFYESDWNMLMPVVEKIAKIETNDVIHNGEDSYFDSYFPRTFGMINSETKQFMVRINRSPLHQSSSLIKATYKAVVEFIKWYNQQSK